MAGGRRPPREEAGAAEEQEAAEAAAAEKETATAGGRGRGRRLSARSISFLRRALRLLMGVTLKPLLRLLRSGRGCRTCFVFLLVERRGERK